MIVGKASRSALQYRPTLAPMSKAMGVDLETSTGSIFWIKRTPAYLVVYVI